MIRYIFNYLCERKQLLLFYLLSIIVFMLIAVLSDQEMAYTGYAVFLVTLVLLCILVVEGIGYIKRLLLIDKIKQRLDILDSLLPDTSSQLEKIYQQLISTLCHKIRDMKESAAASRADSLHYYSLWVHQIKTPIAAMRLILEQDNTDKDLIKQELFKIERYAELALQYIKLQNIADDLVIESCDLNALVKEAVREYSLLFVLRGLNLQLAPLASSVISDKKWLLFILKQLLSNAVKYTQQGGISIYMSGASLVIEDSGIGIMEEDLPRIFAKGYTGYNGRVDQRASGIGLYLTKWAADALSIDIKITSQVGKGTKVWLSFPQADNLLLE